MPSIKRLAQLKDENRKISMVTAYDYTAARILNESNVDVLLVGDSASMVMHGHSTTVHATLEMMAWHTAAVCKGAPDKTVVADMPFLAHRGSLDTTMDAVNLLMKAGATALKIEGADGSLETIAHICQSGVPVMGHLGLTPQSVHHLGGHKVQATNEEEAQALIENALALEKAGVFALVLEMVPADLAMKVTDRLSIPTIGIGAGPATSGQVLVWHDLLGMNKDFAPRFLRTYLNGFDDILGALNKYDADVKNREFPNKDESY
ncbi:MAG: 3-methyl-2-oxobutanoate hydroxymethyltransferase [Myxococcales bacterium]|nr:3-methyl-2-oxobutanoate hydroxymethyltransferase [Myxococcales bacterium]